MESFEVRGTIKHIHLDNGFWGVVDEKGNRWQPTLPEEMKVNGLKVKVTFRKAWAAGDKATWGEPVRLIEIEKID